MFDIYTRLFMGGLLWEFRHKKKMRVENMDKKITMTRSRMINLIALIVFAVLLQGCASTLKLDPKALNGQKEIYQEGVEAIISVKKTLVAIRPSSDTYSSENRPTIVVSVFNGTAEPFNLSTEDIHVSVDGQPLKVFTYNELVAEIKHKQKWDAIAVALGGAAQSHERCKRRLHLSFRHL